MKNTLLVLLLLLSGCVATKEVENATYMQVSDEDQVVLYDSVYFKSSNVIRLETNEKSLLRGITKLCCDDGKMFIFDDALDKIVIFDMNGNYLNRVCYLGGGPEEYFAANDFCLDTENNQILLLCDRPYKLMRFDYNGKFLSSTKLNALFHDIATVGKFIYMTCPENVSDDQYPHSLCKYDANLNLKASYIPTRGNIKSNLYFNSGVNQLYSSSHLFFTRRFDNSIYQIGENGVEKKYDINFNDNALPDNLIQAEVTNKMTEDFQKRKLVFFIHNVVETQKCILFDTNIDMYMYDKQSKLLSKCKSIQIKKLDYFIGSFITVNNQPNMIAYELNTTILNMLRKNPNPENTSKLRQLANQV